MTHPVPNIKLLGLELKEKPSFAKTMKGKHINVSPDGKIATGAGVYGGYTILSDAPLMKKGLNRF